MKDDSQGIKCWCGTTHSIEDHEDRCPVCGGEYWDCAKCRKTYTGDWCPDCDAGKRTVHRPRSPSFEPEGPDKAKGAVRIDDDLDEGYIKPVGEEITTIGHSRAGNELKRAEVAGRENYGRIVRAKLVEKPHIDTLFKDHYNVLHWQLQFYKDKLLRGEPLTVTEVKAFHQLSDILTKMSREEREVLKQERVEDLSEEELAAIIREYKDEE